MVTMLKDGSAGLREMVEEGANSARNIESISEAIQQFNDAGTRVKAVITGMMASFADTTIFKKFTQEIENLSKAWTKFAGEQKGKKGFEALNELNNLTDATEEYYIKLAEVNKMQSMIDSNKYGEYTLKAKTKELKDAKKELEKIGDKKFKINYDLSGKDIELVERYTAELTGLRIAKGKLNDNDKLSELNFEIDAVENLIKKHKTAAENAKKEKEATEAAQAATLASINSYEQKNAAIKESQRLALEAMKKETEAFNKAMDDKEKAIKSLAEFDQKTRIEWLEGDDFRLEIPRKPQLSYPSAERLNFIANETVDGNRFIIDLGPTRVVNSLSFFGLEKSIVYIYEDFIMRKAKWGLKPFTIICPEYFDLGYGTGISVNKAYYFGKNNLGSIIKPMEGSGKFFNIELPYMFMREA